VDSGAEDVGVEELIAEFSLRVVLLEECLVGGHLCVKLLETRRWGGEELCPVRAGSEGSELFFDEGKDGFDCRPLGLPGEVDGEGWAQVGHAEPEIVGGDGAEFGDEEMRSDAAADLFDGENGFVGAVAGDEVFGLEFGATAGSEVHFEVGETLVPGARNA